MSDQLPSWMGTRPVPPVPPAPQPTPSTTPVSNSSKPPSTALPAWLTGAPVEDTSKPSKEERALMFVQFEAAFPRILEQICAGSTLANALRSYPIPLDTGSFTTWIYKDARRKSLYLEAKEVRAESWTSEMIRHALGKDENGDDIPTDLDRSKVIIDTYKWLVSRQARKEYGDTKTIEMNTTISITAAMAQANERVISATVVDSTDDDIDLMDSSQYKQLPSPVEMKDEDDD